MLFLQPIYDFLNHNFAHQINHFALVKLILFSLDKTIFYFTIFVIIRLCWLIFKKERRSFFSEFCVWLFSFYMILLFMLTTFRDTYFPWQLTFDFSRPLSDINFIFMKETFKLVKGTSLLDFFYNSFGNILWFIPFGMLSPIIIKKKKAFFITATAGLIISVLIESLQFILRTGVSDIDDVVFNTCGAIIGYGIYAIIIYFKREFS